MSSDIILSTKHAILSSSGTRYNDLFYSVANSSVSLLECTFGWQNIISLPSLQFGSSSQINIPIDQFIGDIVLHLRLPNTQANETLARGWGYAMLQSISYTFGNSSSTAIVLQNDAIFMTAMAQCNDSGKRRDVMHLAGEQILQPQVAPPGGDIPFIDAYILLPFPMSTLCGDKLPYDSTMLQSNITLQIQFNQNPNLIYGGAPANPHPTAFTIGEIMLRQGKLSNQSASVRSLMIADPNLNYSYPYIHSQYFQSQAFNGVRQSDQYQGCTIELNAFSNADLVGISFYVVAITDKAPVGNNSPNPFNTDDISNVLVTFNGSTLFNLPYQSYRLTNMLAGPQTGSQFANSITNPGTTAPFTAFPKDCFMVYLDFSRERSACIQSHFFNVFRLPNQILRIQFNTTQGNSTQYRLYATYFYNAVVETSNGSSLIRID